MFAKWSSTTFKKRDVKAIAEENEQLKKELDILKKQLEQETSLLEEEKSLLADDDDVMAKFLRSEQARRHLEEENEILNLELCKAQRQLEDAAKTLKILSNPKVSHGLLSSLLLPRFRAYDAASDKKALSPSWRSVAALAVSRRCSLADVIVFYQCGNIAGLTRDAKSVIWRAKIDSTICHAVVDERRGCVYYTAYFLFPGVYTVSIKKLEACRSFKSLTPSVKTDTLLQYPHWVFRGIAVDEKQDLLYCCAKFAGSKGYHFALNYKVGVWDLSSLKRDSAPLFFIEYDPATIYLSPPFQPYYCAIYHPVEPEDEYDTILAVSDWRNGRVHVFLVDSNEQQCKFLQTVASEGTEPGFVSGPCAVQFDRLGNLVVADGGNRRLQLFAPLKNNDGSTSFEPKWMSETYKSNIWSVGVFPSEEGSEEGSAGYSDDLTDVLYVGLNDSGKVLCLNTPCFD